MPMTSQITCNRIALRCPELTLKGRNRGMFERVLVENVSKRLAGLGLDWATHQAHGRVYVDVDRKASIDLSEVLTALSEVAGVESVSPALWHRAKHTRQHTDNPNRDLIEQTILDLAREHYRQGGSFAIRVNRVDKRLPMKSLEMERWLGYSVLEQTDWNRVDLSSPDCLLALDVYADGMYFRTEKIAGIGGLPVGTGGRVLALLSGGIDSPVAAFELARRGCQVDFFHISATHSQQRDDQTPVVRLAKSLSRFTLRSRLFTAPATHLDLALGGPYTGYEAILFRRFLVRAGAEVAQKLGALALVSGDSVGQVASQTLENLTSVYRATNMPILQPLIGANKQDTIDTARRIGTYEISIGPYKDCCALLAQSPKTHTFPQELDDLERELLPAYEELLQSTLSDVVWRTFECGTAASDWQTTDDHPEASDASPDTSASPGTRVATVADDDGGGSTER